MIHMEIRSLLVLVFGISLAATAQVAPAMPVAIVNAGFEDVTGQTLFNEFTFGTPVGWSLHGPNSVIEDVGTFTGTLQSNGVDFFHVTAPEGDKISILFNSGREGEGEYGYEQTLTNTLQANFIYELSVEVGNIASGTAQNNQFFNLDEFPGYRVELLAGGVVIAEDDNALTIPEGEFSTSTVSFSTSASHAQLGQNLGIRLVNLNVIPAGFTQATSPDLEVDFDDVRLAATVIPEPSLPSDLTNNGFVDFEDLTVLLANWNKEVTAAEGNLVNADTTPVNFDDLTVLLADWTGPGPAGSPEAALGAEAVPEPSSLLLALLATLGLSFYRRRRQRAF